MLIDSFGKVIEPHIDTSKWEYFDLSCKVRDETDDKGYMTRSRLAKG